MSTEVAISWVERTVCNTVAKREAVSLINQAKATFRHATLIVASELTKNGRSYLARCAGTEFIVVELTAAQQSGLGVVPKGLMRELHYPAQDCELRGESRLTLSDVQIKSDGAHDRRQPLTGICRYEFDTKQAPPITRAALRVQYFHPKLARTLTSFSHCDRTIGAPGGELQFSFPPLAVEAVCDVEEGWLVLFLQLLTASDWRNLSGVQPISNITAKLIELR
jgi:hypothetical protein